MTENQRRKAIRRLVQEVLPELSEDLEYLLQSDAQLEEISREYGEQLTALRQGDSKPSATLLTRLRQEIFRFLNDRKDSPAADRGDYDDDRR